jgi:hypothetical protein
MQPWFNQVYGAHPGGAPRERNPDMTTTTRTPTYLAITDPTIKNWHLGSKERKNKGYCGVELIWPQDTRKVALKVDRADRHHETNPDLSLVTCGACKRSNEYKYATGTATRPAPAVPAAGRPSREARAMTDATTPNLAVSDEALAAAAANADAAARPSERTSAGTERVASAERMAAQEAAAQAPKPRRRAKSRADKAHEAAERDRVKREALAAVDAINAALADSGTDPDAAATPAAE